MKGLPWPPVVKTPVLPLLGEMGSNTGDRTEISRARRWGQKTKKIKNLNGSLSGFSYITEISLT